jgi:DNA-binding response OmpR family regulator
MSPAYAATSATTPWPVHAPEHPALALVPSPARSSVLVVEDDPSVADLLELVLVKDGYDVVVAGTGSEAVRHAVDGDFAAVVLDLMIPPPDGVEVLRQLRAAGRVMPVLLLTARNTTSTREAAIRAGADAYLTKPLSPARLSERISALTTARTPTPMARANALRGVTVRGAGRRAGQAPRPRAPWLQRPEGGDRRS